MKTIEDDKVFRQLTYIRAWVSTLFVCIMSKIRLHPYIRAFHVSYSIKHFQPYRMPECWVIMQMNRAKQLDPQAFTKDSMKMGYAKQCFQNKV